MLRVAPLQRPGTRVLLSTKPIRCATVRSEHAPPWLHVSSSGAELILELAFEPGADPIASLEGDWIGGEARGSTAGRPES